MPLLSTFAKKRKITYFLDRIPKDSRVLEIGSGSGWAREHMVANGWTNYVGIDVVPPADVVGSIKDWRALGLQEGTFDVILAFEVIEHVDCVKECFELLRPGGLLMLTSPVPHFDWACLLLELAGLSQKRTSPHACVYFGRIPLLEPLEVRTFGIASQWGVFRKPLPAA